MYDLFLFVAFYYFISLFFLITKITVVVILFVFSNFYRIYIYYLGDNYISYFSPHPDQITEKKET